MSKLYTQMGTGMISKLRGHFSFCIYDATTVRVLAARDSSGLIPLVQGKLSDNSLFIASGDCYPRDAHSVTEIPPGYYKYGWHAGAVKFANSETEARHSAELASSAADVALAGLFCKPQEKTLKSRRSSLDSTGSAPPKHPERCQKNGVVRRHSMDSRPSKNRSDDCSWWRTNEKKAVSHLPPCNRTEKKSVKNKTKKKNFPKTSESKRQRSVFMELLGNNLQNS